jgi:hypothetical protein
MTLKQIIYGSSAGIIVGLFLINTLPKLYILILG